MAALEQPAEHDHRVTIISAATAWHRREALAAIGRQQSWPPSVAIVADTRINARMLRDAIAQRWPQADSEDVCNDELCDSVVHVRLLHAGHLRLASTADAKLVTNEFVQLLFTLGGFVDDHYGRSYRHHCREHVRAVIEKLMAGMVESGNAFVAEIADRWQRYKVSEGLIDPREIDRTAVMGPSSHVGLVLACDVNDVGLLRGMFPAAHIVIAQ